MLLAIESKKKTNGRRIWLLTSILQFLLYFLFSMCTATGQHILQKLIFIIICFLYSHDHRYPIFSLQNRRKNRISMVTTTKRKKCRW